MEYSIRLNAVNNPEKSVRAFASIVFGDSFKVTNVAVAEGSKGAFVSMPGFRTKERDKHNNPVYRDICNPVTKEFREKLYGDILKLYEEMERSGKAEVEMEAEVPGEPHVTARVTPFAREGSHLAGLASIVLDGNFAVGDMSVLQGTGGLFVAMPSYKVGGKYRDICFPVTKEFREKINHAVLEAYRQAKERALQEHESEKVQLDERASMDRGSGTRPSR